MQAFQTACFFFLLLSPNLSMNNNNNNNNNKELCRVPDWFYNEIIILAWSCCGSHFPGHKLQCRTEGLERTHLNSGGPLSNRLHALTPPAAGGVRWLIITGRPCQPVRSAVWYISGNVRKGKKFYKHLDVSFFPPNRDSTVISLLIITKEKALKCKN